MSNPKYTTIKGMSDILPPESKLWSYVENTARSVFASFGYLEIRTPVLEKTELFARSIGEGTSVVEKEMYTFLDKNGDSLTLRPEATASVARALVGSGGKDEKITKYFYMGPMFRYERPQKGRKRQFHQIGVEFIGAPSPVADAEVMASCDAFFKKLGLKDYVLEINSIGCPKCRPVFNKEFQKFLKSRLKNLCEDCLRRIEKNPLRAFDCKVDECKKEMQSAPLINEFICGECREHFEGVQRNLKELGIGFKLNYRIVRGLDYYVRTAFEFTTNKLGAQNAISAGGRYDGLVGSMGGADLPGVGFSIGIERALLMMESSGIVPEFDSNLVYFALLGENAQTKFFPLINKLRNNGVNCEWDYEGRSLKAQLRSANRLNAGRVVIVGDNEISAGKVVIKDMKTGNQKEIRIEELTDEFSGKKQKNA